MAGSVDNDNGDNENKDGVLLKNVGLSTSFTINFENEDDSVTFKQKKIPKSSNMFVKKHVRTLSLPFSNDYQFVKNNSMKCVGESVIDQKYLHNVGSVKTVKQFVTSSTREENFHIQNESIESTKFEENTTEDKSTEIVSDNDSEGGTYTLDKDNKQVQLARKSIDQVFGISSNAQHNGNDIAADDKFRNKTRMIDEWMERSVTDVKSTNEIMWKTTTRTINSHMKNNLHYVSKIPSPIVTRRELNEATNSTKKLIIPFVDKKKCSGTAIKPIKQLNVTINRETDTKCYLEETENIVAVLQNRLHSNFKTNMTVNDKKRIDETEKEICCSDKYTSTRFNRAFSLRKDRLKNSPSIINSTAIPVLSKKLTPLNSVKLENNVYSTAARQVDNRNSTSIFKEKKYSSPIGSPTKYRKQFTKIDDNLNKKICQRVKSNGSGSRSNSSLSAQEIEFQNWKRRKSYDPLKAAAEDKKKKCMMHSAAGFSSVSTVVLNKKQKSSEYKNENDRTKKAIMRSASFHGLQNKNGMDQSMFSDEDKVNRSMNGRYISSSLSNENSLSSNIPDDDDKDEWVIPKPPSCSLQNTPPESICSRLSLLSNAASSSSVLLTASPIVKVNFTTLLNVTQLSQTIKTTISSLTDSLRGNNENIMQEHRSCFQNENGLSRTHPPVEETESNEINNVIGHNDGVLFSENNSDDEENDDRKYYEFMVDHQLRITLDNLRQIHVAVQELQLVCSNK